MPEAKVEKYKLTPETMAFVKNYKKVKKVGEMLQNVMEVKLMEADQIRQMLQEAEGMTQQMLDNAPQNPTFELSEQDVDKFQINY